MGSGAFVSSYTVCAAWSVLTAMLCCLLAFLLHGQPFPRLPHPSLLTTSQSGLCQQAADSSSCGHLPCVSRSHVCKATRIAAVTWPHRHACPHARNCMTQPYIEFASCCHEKLKYSVCMASTMPDSPKITLTCKIWLRNDSMRGCTCHQKL